MLFRQNLSIDTFVANSSVDLTSASVSMWSSVEAWMVKHNTLLPVCIATLCALLAITSILFCIYKLFNNPVCDSSSNNNTFAMTRLGMAQGMIEYSVDELKQATNNFGENNVIGSGSLGRSYIGFLRGTFVAIKRLAGPHHPRFLAEVINMSNIRHGNVVNLLGYCCENEEQMFIYEYMVNGNMRDYLRGSINLNFKQRISIAIGAAKGLLHLHSLTPPLIHTRFSMTCVFLDGDLNAKVSEAGLWRLIETRYEEASDDHDLEVGSNNQEGLDPTRDVYSFGLFLAELITGEEHAVFTSHFDMSQWLRTQVGRDTFPDKRMNGTYTREALDSVTEIMMSCVAFLESRRPKMEMVVTELEKIYMKYFKSEEHVVTRLALASELFTVN